MSIEDPGALRQVLPARRFRSRTAPPGARPPGRRPEGRGPGTPAIDIQRGGTLTARGNFAPVLISEGDVTIAGVVHLNGSAGGKGVSGDGTHNESSSKAGDTTGGKGGAPGPGAFAGGDGGHTVTGSSGLLTTGDRHPAVYVARGSHGCWKSEGPHSWKWYMPADNIDCGKPPNESWVLSPVNAALRRGSVTLDGARVERYEIRMVSAGSVSRWLDYPGRWGYLLEPESESSSYVMLESAGRLERTSPEFMEALSGILSLFNGPPGLRLYRYPGRDDLPLRFSDPEGWAKNPATEMTIKYLMYEIRSASSEGKPLLADPEVDDALESTWVLAMYGAGGPSKEPVPEAQTEGTATIIAGCLRAE